MSNLVLPGDPGNPMDPRDPGGPGGPGIALHGPVKGKVLSYKQHHGCTCSHVCGKDYWSASDVCLLPSVDPDINITLGGLSVLC